MLNFRALLLFLAITVSFGVAGQLTPGTISISGNSTICSGSTHGVLTSTVPTNTTGNVTYQWKSSTSANGTYSNVASTGLTFSPSTNITADIYYKLFATDDVSTVASSAFAVLVHDAPTLNISSSPSGNVPPAASVSLSALLTNVPTGYNYSYLWSTSATTAAVTVTPSVTTSYTVTATDQYTCATAISASVTVAALLGGQIASADLTVCTGDAPGAMTSTSGASGGTGSGYTYQWEKSTTNNSSGFADITGATSATFTPSATATATTWFRRKVTNYNVDAYSSPIDRY
ncbi:MAG: hypothetical protein P8H05_02180, partial [Schleiferiaceae bacterium]|nr:hypothetical protein [Schleiferiaceae bacterium]